jgi:hypothetical protein
MKRYSFRMVHVSGVVTEFEHTTLEMMRAMRLSAFKTFPLHVMSPIYDRVAKEFIE